MKIAFESKAWGRYLYWQNIDKGKLRKINQLIKECARHPFDGTGKPEPLKGDYAGFWSRRIDDEHRLIYTYQSGKLIIASCRYHYD